MDIIEFLLARISDEEDRARYASEAHPTDLSWWAFTEPLSEGRDSATRRAFRHIDKHSPRQVLDDCAAKRQIVKAIAKQNDETAPISGYVLRCLALSYKDHSDYRKEWAPYA
jgi:hypothetical protein